MRKIQETLQAQSTTDQYVMYIAFELSNSTWRLAFSEGNKKRHVTIKARDLKQLEFIFFIMLHTFVNLFFNSI